MLEFRTERLGSELRRHGKLAGNGIGGDELDLVDANGGILVIAKALLDVLREVLSFGSAEGKGTNQAGEVVERDFIRKEDAGKPRGVQQVRKAALGLPGLERDAVKQEFVIGDTEEKTSVTTFGQRLLEFVPRRLKLAFGALVVGAIQTGVLDQNIQAVEK